MDLDSQSMTPPSSPIIGYSGCDDEQSLIDSGVIYCLNCKGAPRPNDFSFSTESYILRREVISAVDNLRNDYVNRSGEKPKLLKAFGHLFDPLDQNQIRKMMLICRKNVSSLEILSDSSHSFNILHNFDVSSMTDDAEDLSNQNPWTLRKNVCQFLNVIVRGIRYYRNTLKTEEFNKMFNGLRKSLLPVDQWSSIMKTHSGFRNGNECTAATYHFFHLQLELRWCVYLIFGASPSVTKYLLNDLILLASFKYNSENGVSLDEKQPFNCMCVKEIWTMIRLVTEHLQPEPRREKPFWSIYIEAIKRSSNSDVFFQIWLTSYVAQISDYDIAGAHRPGHGRRESKENGNNAYQYVHGLFKDWVTRGGKSAEVSRLAMNFFQFWGGDGDLLGAIWTQWIQRLDSKGEVSNLESYYSIGNWLSLISQICENSSELCGTFDKENADVPLPVSRASSSRGIASQQRCLGSNRDPFLEFVFLAAAYARWANEKEIKKLDLNIRMKLSRNNCRTNDYGEIGIIRVSSLYMALAIVIESEREAVSTCERLRDIFTYGKGKKTPRRLKAILRAYSCMIIVLLRRKISLKSHDSIASNYMKIIDELLCQAHTDTSGDTKDIAMVYLDLLDSLPKYTPSLYDGPDLGRYMLISSNLPMWLTNARQDYIVRTALRLSQMSEWIVKRISDPLVFIDSTNSSEGEELYLKICEKCMPFMKSNVILASNRSPSTDLEPLACLAADITLLTKTFKRSSKEFETYFEHFALNERTCPHVSQFFVHRLFKSRDIIESGISTIKWTQTWIRLVALGCNVPDELTEIVLSNGFSSTSNRELLFEFCKKASTFERQQLQEFLAPLTPLLKGVMSSTLFKEEPGRMDGSNVINSVITTCATVLNRIKWDRLYDKGSGVAVDFLNLLIPPWITQPWESLSPAIKNSLERNLFNVFQAVASYPGLAQDMFLDRKLQDIVALSFFGFVKSAEEVDRNQHPAIRIIDLSEEKGISQVQHHILPHIIGGDQMLQHSKLCQVFVSAVQMFRSKQLATVLMRILTGIIRAYCCYSETQGVKNICVNAVIYCCLVGSSNTSPFLKELAVKGFKDAFAKELNNKSRLVFDLCMMIASSRNSTNGTLDARRFLKREIFPLLESSVQNCERLRGAGTDAKLREALAKLEDMLANVPL